MTIEDNSLYCRKLSTQTRQLETINFTVSKLSMQTKKHMTFEDN